MTGEPADGKGTIVGDASAVLSAAPLPPRTSIGELKDGYGNRYLLVLNRDFEKPSELALPLKKKSHLYKVCPHCGRQFQKDDSDVLALSLAPGHAELWRVQDGDEEAYTIEYRIEK